MPKEIVKGSAEHTGQQPFHAEVAWGQDSGYVQLATVHERGSAALLELVNLGLRAAGAPVLEPDAVQVIRDALDTQCGPQGFNGWYVTLTDRRDVNALIRHLRRARDGAFGRDE